MIEGQERDTPRRGCSGKHREFAALFEVDGIFDAGVADKAFPGGGYDTKPLQVGIYQIDFAASGGTAQSQAATTLL